MKMLKGSNEVVNPTYFFGSLITTGTIREKKKPDKTVKSIKSLS